MTATKKKAKTKKAKAKQDAPAEQPAPTTPTEPAKPRGRSKPPIDYASAVRWAFATNERINQFMLAHLDGAVWNAPIPPAFGLEPNPAKGRTIRAIVAHLHNVRHMWLVVSAKDAPAPDKVDRATLTPQAARAALAASGEAMLALLDRANAAGGHVKDFKPDVVGFLGYVTAHEAHHRGQICMLARLLGKPLPPAAGYGMWEWNKRGQELEAAAEGA